MPQLFVNYFQKCNSEAGAKIEQLKKPTWKNEYLAWKELDDNDWWGDKANSSTRC